MKKFYQKLSTFAALATVSALSFAAGEDPMGASLDAVDGSGIATKVGALALVIVAVALTFKGPDIAKRVIRKF